MNTKNFLAVLVSISMLTSAFCPSVNASAAIDKKAKGEYKIRLRSGTMRSGNSKSIGKTSRSEKKLRPYIIVFPGPIKESYEQSVKNLGVELLDYLPDYSYLAFMNQKKALEVKELNDVVDVISFESQYKISPELKEKIKFKTQNHSDEEIEIRISTFDDGAELEKEVSKKGAIQLKKFNKRMVVKAKYDSISDLAQIDSVKYIEEVPKYTLNNDIARGIIGAGLASTSKYEGEGQIVAVADTGLDNGKTGLTNNTIHADLRGRVVDIIDRTGGTTGEDGFGHGTHVAGSILGNGQMSNGQIKGTAPKANLLVQRIFDSAGEMHLDSINSLFQEAYDKGARIHSNSWGNTYMGTYTDDSKDIDQFIWDHKDMTILFSAGNDGSLGDLTLSSPAAAKNCITVGATENYRPYIYLTASNNPNDKAYFSSYGCIDGRIKPDIVAPGFNIASTASSKAGQSMPYPGNSNYMYMSGTSMSTPLTSGAVADIREFIQKNYNITPSAALLKAFIINGALSNGYTKEKGWGKVSLYDSLNSTKVIDDASSITAEQTIEYSINCVESDKPLKISLVWTDYPGFNEAGGILVNDLDIVVTSPTGSAYNGNDFTSPYNSDADRLNNVENIIIPNPETGCYKIQVKGHNIAKGPQPFALVSSSDSLSIPKNLRASAKTDSINVMWDAVPGATGYDIEIDGTQIVSLSKPSFDHNNLSYSSEHKYRIRAKSSQKTGEWSNILTKPTSFTKPQINCKVTNNGFVISWSPVQEAQEYAIYANNKLVGIEDSSGTSYTMTAYEDNSPYEFYVKAIKDFNMSESERITAKTLDSGIKYKASMSDTRADFATVASQNGKIYVMGGQKDSIILDTVEEYDPSNDTWTFKGNHKMRANAAAVEANNGKIYLIGGKLGTTCVNTVEEYDPSTDTWKTKSSMCNARSGLGAVCLNGKIYVIGGANGSSIKNNVEVYDISTDTWTEAISMHTNRSDFGISTVNGKIVVIGGTCGTNNISSVEVYDPQLNKWSAKKSMSKWNSLFAMSTLNGKIYASGGKNSNKVEEYDITTDTWSSASELPSIVYGHKSVVLNGKIYILGGFSDGCYKNQLIEYTSENDGWVKKNDMKTSKSNFTSAALNGKIYTFGGIGGSEFIDTNVLDIIEEYDVNTGECSNGPKMKYPKRLASSAVVNNKIYICGGEYPDFMSGDNYVFDNMEEYDPSTKTLVSEKAPMPEPRYCHKAVGLNGYVYVIGGLKAQKTLATSVLRYNTSTNEWDTVEPMPCPRINHGVAVYNGKIYVFGGVGYINGSSADLDTVEEYDPETNRWSTLSHMPSVVKYPNVVNIDDRIYILDGNNCDDPKIYEYNPINGSCVTKGTSAFTGIGFGAAAVDGKIYTYCGINPSVYTNSSKAMNCTDTMMPVLTAGSNVMEPKSGTKTIPVSISNVPTNGIFKADVSLTFDKTKLSISNVTPGDALPSGSAFTYNVDSAHGKVTIQFTGDIAAQRIIKNDGSIANIEFDVLDGVNTIGSTPLNLDTSNCKLYRDTSFEYKYVKHVNGAIDIFMYGDVNGSSTVTLDDFNLVKQYIYGVTYGFPNGYGSIAADVDGNGVINSLDLAYIYKYVNKMINVFPVQQ